MITVLYPDYYYGLFSNRHPLLWSYSSIPQPDFSWILNDCITIRHRNIVYCCKKKKFKKNLILVNIEINVLKPSSVRWFFGPFDHVYWDDLRSEIFWVLVAKFAEICSKYYVDWRIIYVRYSPSRFIFIKLILNAHKTLLTYSETISYK